MTQTPDLEEMAALLRVLGHGVRLALLSSLTTAERSVGEIEACTGIGQPALSQQLGILRKAGLVATRREAKLVYYRIEPERLAQVGALLGALSAKGPAPRRDHPFARSGTAAAFARISRPG